MYMAAYYHRGGLYPLGVCEGNIRGGGGGFEGRNIYRHRAHLDAHWAQLGSVAPLQGRSPYKGAEPTNTDLTALPWQPEGLAVYRRSRRLPGGFSGGRRARQRSARGGRPPQARAPMGAKRSGRVGCSQNYKRLRLWFCEHPTRKWSKAKAEVSGDFLPLGAYDHWQKIGRHRSWSKPPAAHAQRRDGRRGRGGQSARPEQRRSERSERAKGWWVG